MTFALAGPYRTLRSIDASLVERCRETAPDTVLTRGKVNAVFPDHPENTRAIIEGTAHYPNMERRE